MGNPPVTDHGLLISLEGLDGVGKTTQIQRLSQWLKDIGQDVVAVREPGGTLFGEALRELILHRIKARSGLAEFLVFAAARAELMETVVLPVLGHGGVVLMDRFVDSSVAYQAFGHGLDITTIRSINASVTQAREPDLTVWLRGLPFENNVRDQFEQRDIEYFARVEQGYQWLCQETPARWLVIDSRQNADIIFDTLRTRIDHLLSRNQRREH